MAIGDITAAPRSPGRRPNYFFFFLAGFFGAFFAAFFLTAMLVVLPL
jgi:hypothetical protein